MSGRFAPRVLAGWLQLLALTGCASAPSTRPDDATAKSQAEVWFERGVAHARARDDVRAEQYLALAVRAGYPERKALPVLLRVCIEASRLRTAQQYAESYLLRHPGDEALRAVVATLESALHRRDGAEAAP